MGKHVRSTITCAGFLPLKPLRTVLVKVLRVTCGAVLCKCLLSGGVHNVFRLPLSCRKFCRFPGLDTFLSLSIVLPFPNKIIISEHNVLGLEYILLYSVVKTIDPSFCHEPHRWYEGPAPVHTTPNPTGVVQTALGHIIFARTQVIHCRLLVHWGTFLSH